MPNSVKLISVDGNSHRWIKPSEADHLLSRYLAEEQPRVANRRVLKHISAPPAHIRISDCAVLGGRDERLDAGIRNTFAMIEQNAIAAHKQKIGRKLTPFERALRRRVMGFSPRNGQTTPTAERQEQ